MPLNRPTREELLEAVVECLERDLLPSATDAQAFQLRIIRRVLNIVLRELRQGEACAIHEAAALTALLGEEGDAAQLNALLCQRIATGDIAVTDPALLRTLREVADRKLALDSPDYADSTPEDQK